MVYAKVSQNPHSRLLAKVSQLVARAGHLESALQCSEGSLTLTVLRFGLYVQFRWEAACAEECTLPLDADATRSLLGVLKLATDGFEIRGVSQETARLVWKGGALELKVRPSEFHDVEFPARLVARFGASALEALRRVAKFANRSSWGDVLSHVCAEVGKDSGKVVLVATDGYRLAAEWVEDCTLHDDEVLLPVEPLELALHGDVQQLASYWAHENGKAVCGFEVGDVRVGDVCGHEERYPDWRGAFPIGHVPAAVVNVGALAKALKVVEGVQKTQRGRGEVGDVYMLSEGGQLVLQVWDSGTCVGTATVPFVVAAEFPKLRLNLKLLRGVVGALGKGHENVEMRVYGTRKPLLFSVDAGRRLYLLMPMRQD